MNNCKADHYMRYGTRYKAYGLYFICENTSIQNYDTRQEVKIKVTTETVRQK